MYEQRQQPDRKGISYCDPLAVDPAGIEKVKHLFKILKSDKFRMTVPRGIIMECHPERIQVQALPKNEICYRPCHHQKDEKASFSGGLCPFSGAGIRQPGGVAYRRITGSLKSLP